MIYAAVFALVLCAAAVLIWGFGPSKQSQKTELALQRLGSYDARGYRSLELAQPAGVRLGGPLLQRLGAAGRLITPHGRLQRLRIKVERAGRPWGLDLNGLLALKFICLLGGLLVVIVLASLQVFPSWALLGTTIGLVLIAYYLPDIVLRSWINGRQRRISRALPDFLDLLTVTVEAGLGLDSALSRIAEKLHGPLREEILITLHHMRIGQSREEALRELARRCSVPDLDMFVSTLIQSQRLGVPLGDILRSQSTSIRILRRQRIEEAGRKAPVKLLFPLVLCIFPALFVVLVGPAAILIYEVIIK